MFALAALILICSALWISCRSGSHQGANDATSGVAAAGIRFRDVTVPAGIRFSRTTGARGRYYMPESMGGGGAFLDYDNDGYLDILLINGDWWPGEPLPGARPTLALYHNNRNGTFTDVTRAMGLDVSLQGMGVAVGDFDNDGWDDVYITAVGGNHLFHNLGGKRFVDVTARAGVADGGWSTSAAWLDYDNDGRLDLFVCHYLRWSRATDVRCGELLRTYCNPRMYPGESCRLYHNEGGGHFKDVTRAAGLSNPNAKALGVCVVDLDDSGRPSLIVTNDIAPNLVYRNNGDGTFSEIGFKSGIAVNDVGAPRAGMGVDIADYRDNGIRGIAIGNFYSEGITLCDLTNGLFSLNRADEAGLLRASYPYVTFGLFFSDFDNDGWPDLFAANGHIYDTVERTDPGQTYAQPGLLFRNRGDGTFEDVSLAAGEAITQRTVGRGACRGDFDNDGKMDILLIPNAGPPHLLHNETSSKHHWLRLKLIGTKCNRDGYGARVTVETSRLRQTAYVNSGSSYLSAHDNRCHFGLGMETGVNQITVRWPDGTNQATGPCNADQIMTITER
jgi:hypothetical protein